MKVGLPSPDPTEFLPASSGIWGFKVSNEEKMSNVKTKKLLWPPRFHVFHQEAVMKDRSKVDPTMLFKNGALRVELRNLNIFQKNLRSIEQVL